MSTGSKLTPAEFLAELQRDLNRPKAPTGGPAVPETKPFLVPPLPAAAQRPGFPPQLPPPPVATSPSLAGAAETGREPAAAGEQPRTAPSLTAAHRPAANAASLGAGASSKPSPANAEKANAESYTPRAPESLEEAGLNFEDIERLILKFLLSRGVATGRTISAQVCLSFTLVEPILKSLKQDQLVVFKSSAAMGDYEYILTENGRDRGRRYLVESSYFGSATVTLEDYLKAMSAQSIAKQFACEADLHRAFSDLIINTKMLDRLGPAINSGRGMFLFGEPGNGKTSIAERITSCFGSTIWIPRALGIQGDIIRVFDPAVHTVIKQESSGGLLDNSNIDQRWVQIKRPTIIAGGELTMEELEVRQNQQSKVCEAPLQLKSNCGTFVIDDFGRQRMPVTDLLNRWIVPLEKRYDFLNLPSGKKIQVPFDQLIIFSTNLEPKDLVDGAFLRRIPYKIEVTSPTEEEFRKLFAVVAPGQGFTMDDEAVKALDHLIEKHYRAVNRPFRSCQPRDLLLQVRNFCLYKSLPRKITPQALDFAVDNYFSVM